MNLALASTKAPLINWQAISPLLALTVGICLVLLVGLLRSRSIAKIWVPASTLLCFAVTAGLSIWQWHTNTAVISRALAIDGLTTTLTLIICAAGGATVVLSWREAATREAGSGEYFALLLTSVLGMVVLVAAQNFVSLFLGFELLSIPLYVLCASSLRRATSLESGLKYLIVGSIGSATLVYGLAFIYGATGSTDFHTIAALSEPVRHNGLLLVGLALITTGLAFKASVAPFHQWTPDVYEGAPTPVTAFMAVATKAAAFGVLLRLFDVCLIGSAHEWAPALATLAAVTIAVGNAGAIGQSSLKRLLAYSSVAQAGYMLTGVVVSTKLGVAATIFYLACYLVMNLAAFAVVVVRERESDRSDDISSLYGLGAERPVLAWTMTVAMLALAGFPATAGFFGKLYLIDAAIDNNWSWLGVLIVIGSAVSLTYYLRVVAAVWMQGPIPLGKAIASIRPRLAEVALAGASSGSAAADLTAQSGSSAGATGRADITATAAVTERPGHYEAIALGAACSVATVFVGVYPEPLFRFAQAAGNALKSLL